MLCRFMEQSGTETAFILTDAAIKSFEACEEDKALDREIEDADDDERVVDRSGKEVELSKGLEIFWDIATNLL